MDKTSLKDAILSKMDCYYELDDFMASRHDISTPSVRQSGVLLEASSVIGGSSGVSSGVSVPISKGKDLFGHFTMSFGHFTMSYYLHLF